MTGTGFLTPLQQLKMTHFGDADAPNLDDLDLDGSSNLVDYARARDPHGSSQHQLPAGVLDANTILRRLVLPPAP